MLQEGLINLHVDETQGSDREESAETGESAVALKYYSLTCDLARLFSN